MWGGGIAKGWRDAKNRMAAANSVVKNAVTGPDFFSGVFVSPRDPMNPRNCPALAKGSGYGTFAALAFG